MGKFTHLYQLTTWKKLRRSHLRANPLCVKCIEEGTPYPGNTVDHKVPHKGNLSLFFNPANLQTLCHAHHSKDKQQEELHGYSTGVGEDGLPTHPNHPWNRKSVQPPVEVDAGRGEDSKVQNRTHSKPATKVSLHKFDSGSPFMKGGR